MFTVQIYEYKTEINRIILAVVNVNIFITQANVQFSRTGVRRFRHQGVEGIAGLKVRWHRLLIIVPPSDKQCIPRKIATFLGIVQYSVKILSGTHRAGKRFYFKGSG